MCKVRPARVYFWLNTNTPVGPVNVSTEYARRHFNTPLASGRGGNLHPCVRACVRSCVCACVRACVRACVCACVCVCVCVISTLNTGPRATTGHQAHCPTTVGQKHSVAVGGKQTLTLMSDNVLRLTRIAHARFLSDGAHCPSVV